MNKLVTVLASAAAALVLVISLTAAALSTGKKPVVSQRTKPLLKKIAQLQEENPTGRPSAVTPRTEFDFGILNPNDTKSHPFRIRNNGSLLLTLSQGPTTCKCTVADLPDKSLFPGEETEVRLEWNVGRSEQEFRQSATILTNDPDRPEIVFHIHGKVRLACYAEPQSVRLPDILPGKSETAEAFVCSQKWESFSISNIETTIEGSPGKPSLSVPKSWRASTPDRAIG